MQTNLKNHLERFHRISVLAWINQEQIKGEKGTPIEFNDHRFLIDIFEDPASNQVIRKGAQIGMSTTAILKVLHSAIFRGINQIYTLPTVDDVRAFVPGKVNQIIEANECIKKAIEPRSVDAVEQKQFGKSFIYFKGTFTEREAIILTSDRNIYDELDKCFEEGTEILTKKGWQLISDITEKDKVATLTKDGRAVFKHPTEIIKTNYEGKLYRFIGRSLDIGVTPNHQIWAKIKRNGGKSPYAFHRAENLIDKKFVMTSRGRWESDKKDRDYIALPRWQTTRRPRGSSLLARQKVYFRPKKLKIIPFYKFLGWYISEGNVRKIKTKGVQRAAGDIIITQKDIKNREEIKQIIGELGYKYRENNKAIIFRDLHLALYLQRLGKSDKKYIPKNILWGNPKYLSYLLETLLKGDGDERNVYTTKSKRLADEVQIIVLRIGKTASIYKNSEGIYKVGINKFSFVKFNKYGNSTTKAKVEIEKYCGKVYCVTVPPYHTILVRGKNKKKPVWCGNSKMEVVRDYASRLGFSKIREQYYFSTPTIPDFGIDKLWNESDQKHWRFNCPACNFRQHMEWEKNVDLEREIYVCQKCRREITPRMIKELGEWEAKYPDRDVSGYWVSQMIAPWRTAAELIQELEEAEDEQYFYNFVLGLPYLNPEAKIPASLILKNLIGKEKQDQRNCAMGVDVGGKDLHVIIGNEKGSFGIARIEDQPAKTKWQRLGELIEVYEVRFCIIDAAWDTNEAYEFAKRFPNKVYLCWYKEDPKKEKIVRFFDEGKFTDKSKDWETEIKVYVDRNRSIDDLISDLRKSKIKFNFISGDQRIAELIEHIQSVYSRIVTDKLGIGSREWVSSTGRDHFLHALNYFKIALDKKIRYEAK